ncbi:hypothetical protein ACHHYP_07563 [Achlya hypogyna]|uniref:PiggyBac transposable element-derived protein domain-containing protein n=1 Tax=Achlya hypogyna TaxID=1202772 RepID=A0A1V9YR05_ACHHY|nr:hypothetical protein ACHHYP_07563 [Achlya hypogyna]
MSRHRFQAISSAMTFDRYLNASDPWAAVRPFVDCFNAARKAHFVPGNVLVVDECMCGWRGREGKYCVDGMPHKTKIPRKPESIGVEMKAVACGESGILLRIEIMEGKERQKMKAYADKHNDGTAVALRLTQDYNGTKRTVIGDSAFASVRTLVALWERGLYFMGHVKTAHCGYPKTILEQWNNGDLSVWTTIGKPARGSHLLLESNNGDQVFYALGWQDRKMLKLITNRGTTIPGSNAVRMRHRRVIDDDGFESTLRYALEIKRPHMVEAFYQYFCAIDVHDHLRQGSLAMEMEWLTHKWWHRIVATIFGMVVVDAYLGFHLDTGGKDQGQDNFISFIDQLAYQLINNHDLPALQ